MLAPDSVLVNSLASLPEDAAQQFQEGLPTDQHFATLSSEPAAAQVAAQHHALLMALQNSSGAVLSGMPGGVSSLFRRLIAISGANKDTLKPHLTALLYAVEDAHVPAVFLTEQLGVFAQSAAGQV